METTIAEFLGCSRIAVVGFSRNERKFGSAAFTALKERGYDVYAVNRHEKEIRGVRCFPDLTALRGMIDGVFISIPPAAAEAVLDEAAALGLSHVWLQQGAASPALVEQAERLGLKLVNGKCILMYLEPVTSIHRLHRGLARLFRTY